MSLFQTALKQYSNHPVTKPLNYYQIYDDFLNHHNLNPMTILEVGTFMGESTMVLSKTFPDAQILTLDIQIREIDFSDYPNVTYIQADQINRQQLNNLVAQHFPGGIDLVIEDASHFGSFSKITFDTLFPHVKSGSGYFIEDWGTGYWDTWPDGGRFQEFPQNFSSDNIPRRLHSHDFGMVGFVKSLVDYTHESAIKNNQTDVAKNTSRIRVLEFGEGVCMAIKS